MIMASLGNDVPQCQQVSDRIMKTDSIQMDCCQHPDQCNRTGWPLFEKYGFDRKTSTDGSPQSMQDIQSELDAGHPFAFSWQYYGGGGHMMVATQIVQSNAGPQIWVNDPDKTADGDSGAMVYDTYNADPNWYTHWRDYFNIVKQP
jgi:hypothetical protein